MSKIKEYCDANDIAYMDIDDGGIAIDVAKLTPENLDGIKELIEGTPDTSFEEFWDEYHKITGLKKTDMQAAKKYWKKMIKREKRSALENITPWFKSLKEPKGSRYIKKARTYLGDKNYLDEFGIEYSQGNPKTPEQSFRADGRPAKISIESVAVNNYAEYEQYCKEHKYNPETGESLI